MDLSGTSVIYSTKKDKQLSFIEVLIRMRENLKKKRFSQIPELSSSRPLDVYTPFEIIPKDCSGHFRAVLIGINYVGQRGQLSGCHNDVNNVKEYLNKIGFKDSNMTILMDDGYHVQPTNKNIMNALTSLVQQSKSGDAVFVHYSGHGGSVEDVSGDEEDGYDETLIPVDFATAGQILDDDLYKTFVCPLRAGVTMTCLMDCCHSGSVLDLPYRFAADGKQDQMEPVHNFDFGAIAGFALTYLATQAFEAASNGGGGSNGDESCLCCVVKMVLEMANESNNDNDIN